MAPNPEDPIGFIDSGLGGLTVLKEVRKILPQENLIYLGDTAGLPYGNKSPETIWNHVQNNVRFLLKKKIKLLVLPCFTAAAHTLGRLQSILPIPVIGITSCSIDYLIQNTKTKQVAILGTNATIRSNVLQRLIRMQDPSILVTAIACPLLVSLIESGLSKHPIMHAATQTYLQMLQNPLIDTILLACTHYPLIQNLLKKKLSFEQNILDPALPCATAVHQTLSSLNLLNCQTGVSAQTFYTTKNPDHFRLLAASFFNTADLGLDKVHLGYTARDSRIGFSYLG